MRCIGVTGGRVLFSFQHEQVVDSKQGLFWLVGRSFVIDLLLLGERMKSGGWYQVNAGEGS